MGRGLQAGADFQLNLMKRNAQIQLGGRRLFAVFVSSLVFFRAVLLMVAGFVFVTGHQEKCCQLLQCGGSILKLRRSVVCWLFYRGWIWSSCKRSFREGYSDEAFAFLTGLRARNRNCAEEKNDSVLVSLAFAVGVSVDYSFPLGTHAHILSSVVWGCFVALYRCVSASLHDSCAILV